MPIRVHNITIDGSVAPTDAQRWDADQYERVVRRNLIRIFTSRVGHAIVPQITRQLRIVPHFTIAPDRAETGPHDYTAARLRGTTAYQCSPPNEAGAPAMGEPIPNSPLGTGVGSDVTIWYTPADAHDPTRRYGGIGLVSSYPRGRPGSYSDEILCHELVHAIRQMRGVMQCIGRGHNYATHEEFCAVEVTNVYAACHSRPVAGDYWGDTERTAILNPITAASPRELDEARWIERMQAEQPGFVYAMSQIPHEVAWYNPFRKRDTYIRYVQTRY